MILYKMEGLHIKEHDFKKNASPPPLRTCHFFMFHALLKILNTKSHFTHLIKT